MAFRLSVPGEYQKPKFARRKPPFEHRPITEPGIYEIRTYDIDEIAEAKENGIEPPNRYLEPDSEDTIMVYEDTSGQLYLAVGYPDIDHFTTLKDWGADEWEEWYNNPDADDDYFVQRKIATNPNKLRPA